MKNDDGGFSCIPSILQIMPYNYYINADIRRLVHQCIDLKQKHVSTNASIDYIDSGPYEIRSSRFLVQQKHPSPPSSQQVKMWLARTLEGNRLWDWMGSQLQAINLIDIDRYRMIKDLSMS